jgi:hypothetical protein
MRSTSAAGVVGLFVAAPRYVPDGTQPSAGRHQVEYHEDAILAQRGSFDTARITPARLQ